MSSYDMAPVCVEKPLPSLPELGILPLIPLLPRPRRSSKRNELTVLSFNGSLVDADEPCRLYWLSGLNRIRCMAQDETLKLLVTIKNEIKQLKRSYPRDKLSAVGMNCHNQDVMAYVLQEHSAVQALLIARTMTQPDSLAWIKGILFQRSVACWELCETIDEGGYEHQSSSIYCHDLAILQTLKMKMLERCLAEIRVVDMLEAGPGWRQQKIDNALWRIWTSCLIFGEGRRRMDMQGSVIAWQHILAEG
ncbi:hypothetical protein EMCG_07510, partial [[Emmonsia] crescens]